MAYIPPAMRRQKQEQEKEVAPVAPAPVAVAQEEQPSSQGGKGGKKGGWKGDRGGKGPEEPTTVRRDWGNTLDADEDEGIFRQSRHATGLNFDKYDSIPVEVSGGDGHTAVPLEEFTEEVLHPLLLENIDRNKYTKPTPIQKYTVPLLLKKHDLMACAQTGSGKTAAFLFPIINCLLLSGPRAMRKKLASQRQVAPESLILAPTRELAVQIYEEAKKFTYKTGLRAVSVYGGVDPKGQIADLDKGCQILVATPGRLLDLCSSRDKGGKGGGKGYGKGPPPKLSLSNVYFFCLDEADRMLDLGFEEQLRKIATQREMPCPQDRQTLMFSATFPSSIQALATDFLARPYFFVKVGKVGSTNAGITQTLEYCHETEKRSFLLALLHHANSKKLVLVFVDTKSSANDLVANLIDEGFSATSIHGDRTQQEREAALKSFRKGETPILVATDLASRGLDIPNVSHVVQYDLAHSLDDYTHRIGRTGRAGNLGLATAFFNERNKSISKSLLTYLTQHDQEVPQKLIDIVHATTRQREAKERSNAAKQAKPEETGGGGRTISRRAQLALQEGKEKEVPTYNAGNMLLSMMGSGGGQY